MLNLIQHLSLVAKVNAFSSVLLNLIQHLSLVAKVNAFSSVLLNLIQHLSLVAIAGALSKIAGLARNDMILESLVKETYETNLDIR